jgi:hypothetical protein
MVAAAPNCGKGVTARKVIARYSAKQYDKGGYRTDVLFCGNSKYGYRHLSPHVGQYFGGWGAFSFSIAEVLKVPAVFRKQSNGNFLESAPIYQCFYDEDGGYFYVWTFTVIATITGAKYGTIVTAYGHRGRRVNELCP